MKRFLMILPAVVFAICVGSCSVKEDRSPCPCWLQVIYLDGTDIKRDLAGFTSEQIFNTEVAQSEALVEVTVPRTYVTVSSCRRMPGVVLSGKEVRINKGSQADSLYAHSATIDCRGEDAVDTVRHHKQFSTVYLSFENTPDSLETRYDVRVKGNVCGMDLTDLSAVEGEFEFSPQEQSRGRYQFRIPRQKDDTMVFELLDRKDGGLVDTISAGVLIRESGFDWTDVDLNDIVITIDFAKVTMEVKVREWDSREIYDVTI